MTNITAAELYERFASGEGPIYVPVAEYTKIVAFLSENSFGFDKELGTWVRIPPRINAATGAVLLLGRDLWPEGG